MIQTPDIDLTNVTGLVTVDAKFTNATNDDQIEIIGMAAGVVKTTSTQTADNLVLTLADATGTSDSITLEVTAANTDNDVLNIDAAGGRNTCYNQQGCNYIRRGRFDCNWCNQGTFV